PLFLRGGAASGRGEHPAGEPCEQARGGKARLPRRGIAPPVPAHRRRLAGPSLLRHHDRGCPRRPADSLARNSFRAALGYRELTFTGALPPAAALPPT